MWGCLIAVAFLAFALAALTGFWLSMPGKVQAGSLPQIEPLLEQHVRNLSYVRTPLDAASLQRAAEYIATQLAPLAVTRVPHLGFDHIVATLPGELPEIIIGAHYDTDENTPGADDNASGVAVMIELARRLDADRPKRQIRFVAFTHEEEPYFQTPHMGSYQFARSLSKKPKVMLSLEMLGYYDDREDSQGWLFFWGKLGNYLTFVGDFSSHVLVRDCVGAFRNAATGLASHGASVPQWLPGASYSDHWSFWKAGIPAIMVTDTAMLRNHRYHRKSDLPETLDYQRMTAALNGLEKVVRELAK